MPGRNRSAMPASYQFSQLQRDLNRMGSVQRKKIRREAERIGQSALSDAKSRAGAWSTRIPSAISMRGYTDMTRGRVGVELRVDVTNRAPHARVYEGISQQGSIHYFRHPVFADANKPRDEWTWTQKNSHTRPYLWPAVRGRQNAMRTAVQQVVDEAARECGFR